MVKGFEDSGLLNRSIQPERVGNICDVQLKEMAPKWKATTCNLFHRPDNAANTNALF